MTRLLGEYVYRAAPNKLKAVESDIPNDRGGFRVDSAPANSPLINELWTPRCQNHHSCDNLSVVVGVINDPLARRSRVSICNVLQTPSHVCPRLCHTATDLSQSSCKFHFNAATPSAELCTFSPSLLAPPSALHFPSCCHGEVFAPALYYLCQQRLR